MIRLKTERSKTIHLLLHEHVNQRLKKVLDKWEGRNDALAKQEINKANEKYELSKILEKGAACSVNIAVATHIAKAVHPDLKVKNVTNLNIRFGRLNHGFDISSHLLSDEKSLADTTGDGAYNSTAYELYLLLDLRFDGKSLGELIQQDDQDAIAAFCWDVEDDVDAKNLVNKYAALLDEKVSSFSTDTKAKQVYWCVAGDPVDDANYHLLQPLFSSSLAHEVHQQINDARFGEQNTAARQAYFKKAPYSQSYRDYRGLVMRKLGGTKPQNISQLNSERGGVNYLLSSSPPRWKQDHARNLLQIETVFDRFYHYENVSNLIRGLVQFLKANPEPTMETRITREKFERTLGESLAAFGLANRQFHEDGWTRDINCKLSLCEQLWLDPMRTELPLRPGHEKEDAEFQQAYEWKDWPDEVAHRFGNWLNAILLKEGLPVGDAEHAHWAKQALIDAEWPAPMQRRSLKNKEVANA